MEYCFLRGFLLVLLIQYCSSEGLSTSTQSSMVDTFQDGQALPKESERPPAEVVPMVAPPSLKEVQQAVQEASEQVEGRGAEEVLKELLERVVEAALGQVEGGGETKVDEAAEQEAVKEDALRAETDTEAEVLEQAVEGEVEGEDIDIKGADTGVDEEVAEVDVFEDIAIEEKGVVGGDTETAASVEETTAGVETRGRDSEEMKVTDESPETKVSREVVEEAAAILEETGGYLAVEKAGVEDNKEQVELLEEKGAAETDTQEAEETPPAVEVIVGAESEEKTEVKSDPSPGDAEQIGDFGGKKEALEEETQEDEMKGEMIVQPSDNYEIETLQTVVGEPVEEKEEEEINIVKDSGAQEEDNQGHLVVEGVPEEVEAKGTDVGGAEGSDRLVESVITEESVALVNEGGDQQAGEEEQIALETSNGSEKEDQEVLLISAPEADDGADASIEQSPENQAPTTSPSLGGVEVGDEKSNNGNEIITPTGDLLPYDPTAVQPTLDNFVKDVLAEPPQAAGEEPGEINELVEDKAGTTEISGLGLEAWKIGAISAAVLLVLETVVIVIYILKCRNKSSALALQQACEEGSVEPEAATGGDCRDDTLPAGNGDTQQLLSAPAPEIHNLLGSAKNTSDVSQLNYCTGRTRERRAGLDALDMASTLTQNKEQHKEEDAMAMSDLPPGSIGETANTGSEPNSSQDLRTSVL